MLGLSAGVIEMAREAVCRARPGISERDSDLLFVDVHYGHALAERLKRYLEHRA